MPQQVIYLLHVVVAKRSAKVKNTRAYARNQWLPRHNSVPQSSWMR